jgi:hypothetical protein
MMDEDIEPQDSIEALQESGRKLREMLWRREAKRKAALRDERGRFRKVYSHNRYIRSIALTVEPIGKRGAELWITYSNMRETWLRMQDDPFMREHCNPDALNGYVAFPKRHAPKLPVTVRDLVQYIPVHGGVTWACKDSLATVYGFDTGHAGSEKLPIADQDWIKYQCYVLYHGLEVAEQLWPAFRRERDVHKRAEMAQKLIDIEPAADGPLHKRLGFTALITTFFGGEVG